MRTQVRFTTSSPVDAVTLTERLAAMGLDVDRIPQRNERTPSIEVMAHGSVEKIGDVASLVREVTPGLNVRYVGSENV